jgi:hypothetical protein
MVIASIAAERPEGWTACHSSEASAMSATVGDLEEGGCKEEG